MRVLAVDASHIYSVLVIETDVLGVYYVTDKSGPNVVSTGPFHSMADAQREWSRRAEEILK